LHVRVTLRSILQKVHLFFFQAEDGIRDRNVTGVQTCALPISVPFTIIEAINGFNFGSRYSPKNTTPEIVLLTSLPKPPNNTPKINPIVTLPSRAFSLLPNPDKP